MSGSRYANIPKLSKGLLKRADFLYMCLASPSLSEGGKHHLFNKQFSSLLAVRAV